jgi:hypothetical protein
MTKRKKKAMNGSPDLLKSSITHRGPVSPKAMAAFQAGQGWLATSEEEPMSRNYARDEALQAFERALVFQPDFIDAHLWIARLSQDRQTKRDHLEFILKRVPNHEEAKRLLDELGNG